MASIRFYIQDKKNGTGHIMASFQNGSACTRKYLGYPIPATKLGAEFKFWNKNTSRVRSLAPKQMSEINKKITDWQTTWDNFISDCNLNNEAPEISAFLAIITGTAQTSAKYLKGNKVTLLQAAAAWIETIKSTHSSKTKNKYKVLEGQLKKFQQERRSEIFIHQIDKSFYKELSVYLMSKEGNTNLTIARKQKAVITIINFAIDELKVKNINPEYKKPYKLKTTPAAKFPLRPEELATLRAYHTDNEYHRMVLDAFLLACETGLRHSDIIQLLPAHIQSNVTPKGTIRYIALTNIKTDKQNSMSLSVFAGTIIDRYINCEEEFSRKTLFRFQHSQAAGKVLRTICKKDEVNLNRPCEIVTIQGSKTTRTVSPLYDVISFHMARNTYITRLLSSNLSPARVKDNAGHGNLSTTMGYYRDDEVTRWQETNDILNN